MRLIRPNKRKYLYITFIRKVYRKKSQQSNIFCWPNVKINFEIEDMICLLLNLLSKIFLSLHGFWSTIMFKINSLFPHSGLQHIDGPLEMRERHAFSFVRLCVCLSVCSSTRLRSSEINLSSICFQKWLPSAKAYLIKN